MKSFKKKIQDEIHNILQETTSSRNEVLTSDEIQHLPGSIKKWLEASGAAGREKVKSAWIRQKLLIKLKPEQKKWKHAQAQQIITTSHPAFIWLVRLDMAPLVSIYGRDKLMNGKGEMQMKLNGMVNLFTETGEKLDEGTLQRFLGETVWVPSAILSPYISWTEIDAHAAEAVMNYNGLRISGKFFFTPEGFFQKFSTHRYMGNKANAERHEWQIVATEHKEMDGITIPSKLEVTWNLKKGPWTWCKLEVNEINYNITKQQVHFF